MNVPKGRSLMAGSEDEVKIFGVKAVLEVADDGLCGVDLSPGLSGEVVRSDSEAGVLRSFGDALGEAVL